MIHPSVLADEFSQRWERIRKSMLQQGADAMLVTDNVNLYYVSGRVFSGYCYLPADREPLFFVRRPVGLDGDNIVYIRKPEEIGDYLREQGLPFPQTLMLENDSITHNEFLRYEAIFKPATIKNGTAVLRSVRSIKTPYEIGQIRRSGILHAEVYAKIPSLYKKGMTDLDLSVEIERESRLLGSLGIFRIFGQSMEIFMGSVIAGDNADNPSPYDFAMGGAGLDDSLPVGCNGTMLEERMSVMVDLGGNFTGYMTDMTRTFAIGDLQELAYKAHETSIEIQRSTPKQPAGSTCQRFVQHGHRNRAGSQPWRLFHGTPPEGGFHRPRNRYRDQRIARAGTAFTRHSRRGNGLRAGTQVRHPGDRSCRN